MASRQVIRLPKTVTRREWLAGLAGALAAGVSASRAFAQNASSAPSQTPASSAVPANASAAPALEGLSSAEFAALRPLAMRGAALLIRDADQGPNARVTVLVRARAPIATVRTVVTTPEMYMRFMPTLTSVDILSRHGAHTAFRFQVNAILFDVSTVSALHRVSDHRVDVDIVQSDLGPGVSRWDIAEDGDATLIALTTRGDPSRGNWLLRQVAARSPNAIAAMNISADMILALGVARHSEILAGRNLPERPRNREAPTGPLEPPARGAWTALTHHVAIGSIALDEQGSFTQSTMALWTPLSLEVIRSRLDHVEDYPSFWHGMRDFRIVARDGGRVRYQSTVHSALAETRGEEEREIEAASDRTIVRWRGVSGDHRGYDHRWDLVADPAGGTLVMLTGGSEYNRTGGVTAAMIDRDVWLLPGYATSWKMVWMRPLLENR